LQTANAASLLALALKAILSDNRLIPIVLIADSLNNKTSGAAAARKIQNQLNQVLQAPP